MRKLILKGGLSITVFCISVIRKKTDSKEALVPDFRSNVVDFEKLEPLREKRLPARREKI